MLEHAPRDLEDGERVHALREIVFDLLHALLVRGFNLIPEIAHARARSTIASASSTVVAIPETAPKRCTIASHLLWSGRTSLGE